MVAAVDRANPALALAIISIIAAFTPLVVALINRRKEERTASGQLDDLLLDNAKDAVTMANQRADRAEERSDRLEERVNRLDQMLTEAQATIRGLQATIRDHEQTIRELQRAAVRAAPGEGNGP